MYASTSHLLKRLSSLATSPPAATPAHEIAGEEKLAEWYTSK